ncbi:hypothetical protein ACWKWU_17560 [Chitinophaga lutea]
MRSFYSLTAACLLAFLQPLAAQDAGLPDSTRVLFLLPGDSLPAGATLVGDLKIVDKGFKMKCNYHDTMAEAREKARKKGGNTVLIEEFRKQKGSTCYMMKGGIYKVDDISQAIASANARSEAIVRSLLPDTASYALLYVYRPASSVGALIGYQLNANDSAICRVKNGSKEVVRLQQNGITKIWAKTETEEIVQVDIQPGQVYFLRCAVQMGAFVGRPDFSLVDPRTGLSEYNSMKEKKSKGKDKEDAE